jgi:transposase
MSPLVKLVVYLSAIKNTPKSSYIYNRLRAIISAKEHSISHISNVLDITPKTLRSWVHRFQHLGVSGLSNKQKTGRIPTIKKEHEEVIEKWIKEDSQMTINAVKIKLEEEFSLSTNKSSVHNTLKKLKYSYITPRPKHYKKKEIHSAEFKKKSTPADKQCPN